jgi:chromosome segregation ATPase
MPTQTPSGEQETTPSTQPQGLSDPNISFADYQKLRREGVTTLDAQAPSAPSESAQIEQKKSSKSDTEETEANTEAEGEEDDESDKPDAEKGEKPKKKGGWQRRIEKLVGQREEERRQRQALEARLAQLEARAGGEKSQVAKPSTEAAAGKPDPATFETHAEYVEALADWKYEQRSSADKANAERARLISEQETLQKTYLDRLKSFTETHDDFQDVLDDVSDIPVPAHVQGLLMQSEHGPELVYELGKNRAELERIAKLSPTSAALAIGRLEAKIEARVSASEEKKPETKKVTQAPKPIEPVGKGTSAVAKSIDDPNLSFPDYVKLRREQTRRRRA